MAVGLWPSSAFHPQGLPLWDHPPEHQVDLLASSPAAKGTGCSCCCSTCNEVGRVSGSGAMLKEQEIRWILVLKNTQLFSVLWWAQGIVPAEGSGQG